MQNKIDLLIQETRSLTEQISRLESSGDFQGAIPLKKRYHEAKLEAISLIQSQEQRAGITAQQLIDMVEAMPKQPKYAIGIDAIDRELADYEDRKFGQLGGFETGSFINIAGESGAGKTTFTIDVLANVSEYSKTVFFNHEMGIRRIASRLKQRLNTQNKRDNLIVDSHTNKIDDIINEIALYAHEGIKFFVIDSKMKIISDGDSEVQKNSNVSHKLSKVAHDKDIIVILINQMSESDIKEKRLALKGGGDAKYDSDMVAFLIKDDKDLTKRKFVVTKNRTGDERLFSVDLTIIEGKTVGVGSIPTVIVYEEKKVEVGFVL